MASTETASKIYLVNRQGGLIEMRASIYAKEADFQALLAQHPDLLDGEQFNPEDPRRWLLVGREVSVPDADADRWSLDHLLLDQDAVHTLVEVKRKSDTRLRREVVAQMLDYAANGAAWWSGGWMRDQLAIRCSGEGLDPDEEVVRLLANSLGVEDFWQRAESNLRAGRLRLVFVADTIPKELLTIVEFLNSQFSQAEVFAVELRYFEGGEYSTHIPRVVGRTATAEAVKQSTGRRRTWTRSEFVDDALRRGPPGGGEHPNLVLDLLTRLEGPFRIGWGTSPTRGSFTPVEPALSTKGPISVYTDGDLHIKLHWLDEKERARAWSAMLAERFAAIGLPTNEDGKNAHIKPPQWAAKAEALAQALLETREEMVRSVGT